MTAEWKSSPEGTESPTGEPESTRGERGSTAGGPDSTAGEPDSTAGGPSSAAGGPSSAAGGPGSVAGGPGSPTEGPNSPTGGTGEGAAVPAFAAEGIEVRYGSRRPPALVGVDLRVPAGALYTVLGPNGSGKSTLMRALLGVVPAFRGAARIEGRRVDEWNRRDLARAVGVVSQSEPLAFPFTVRELVEMGRYPHLGPLRSPGPDDRSAVRRALARCDVDDLEARSVDTLSGGELQRVRIARALAQEPRALALDEPTSSLDIRHEMMILRLLRSLADRGITVLLITHNLNMAARFSDRILLLDQGRAAAEGAVEEVIRAPILERVYGWPVSVGTDPSTGAPLVTPLV